MAVLTKVIGAGIGATAGGILGGADGNLDELLQGIMAGAGVGDTVGKGVVEAGDRVTKFVKRNYKRERGIGNKALKDAIEEYKELSQRGQFISKQKEDLEETKLKLENLIENPTKKG